MVRAEKKIDPYSFVMGFILCCCKRVNTFSHWAEQTAKLTGHIISKQALWKRVQTTTVDFCKTLLQDAIAQKAGPAIGFSIFEKFGKVILQDSTTLRLPDCLADSFPGNRTNGIQKAIARIQTIVDIKTMGYLYFSLTGFTSNDQAASPDVLSCCSKEDLVIRDMGYFAMGTFEQLMGNGVYLLSRLRFGVKIYDLNGKEIALCSLLKPGKKTDRIVLIGEKKIRLRLVILPVPKQVAEKKKRKARNDRDKRLNHSKDYYRWLEFNVYVTNVHEDTWSTKEVAKAYRVRWQIEIIFKSWKTGLGMQELLHERCTNANRVKCCIYLMLLFITIFTTNLFLPVLKASLTSAKKNAVSIVKMMKWVCENIFEIFRLSFIEFIVQVITYCCYEKRKDRDNIIVIALNCKN